MSILSRFSRTLPLVVLTLSLPAAAHAVVSDSTPPAQPPATSSATSATSPAASTTPQLATGEGGWFARVDQAKSGQPDWITPLATVTPLLEEEVRYDQYWEHLGNGAAVDSYGDGKGLELIPTPTNEIIINVPNYEVRSYVKPADGFADETFLVKQRLASSNEEHGNYVVTAFLGLQVPSGSEVFTDQAYQITPTIAGGKGYGRADVQGTFGVTLPTGYRSILGNAFATNVAFQYNVGKFWPEFEVNDTYWSGGERGGKNQVLLTPGVIVGRFKLGGRFKANLGVGYQFAAAPSVTKEPALTPTYSDAWLSTFRVSF